MSSYAVILVSPPYLVDVLTERIALLEHSLPPPVAGQRSRSEYLPGRIAEARYWLDWLQKAMIWEAPDAPEERKP